VRFHAAAVVVLAAALVGGCEDSGRSAPTPSSSAPAPAPASLSDLRAEAAALAGRRDYTGAEQQYREALKLQPDDFDLHYGLASVLSQLDKRAEAIEEFRWVAANGSARRPEVDAARRWLAEAEASPPPATTASATRGTPPPAIKGEAGATGSITGKVTWPGLPEAKDFTIRVIVDSEGGPRARKIVRSKLNGAYTVGELPPGTYKLMAAAGTVQMWKSLSVTVNTGQETVLDLSPANAAISPTEFAGR
jgi:tetratricopeptide (TPR) repeat protein